jgi:hypothetical protein
MQADLSTADGAAKLAAQVRTVLGEPRAPWQEWPVLPLDKARSREYPTSSSFSQSLSDWAVPGNLTGESVGFSLPYRLVGGGSRDARTFYGYAYSFNLDPNKEVRSISLPSNRYVLVFGLTLVPAR